MGVRQYPDVPRIYCDMDGVLADFGREMARRKMTASELKVIPGTYARLEPIDGAKSAIKEILSMGFFVMVLTKIPSENAYAASEKILWLQRHFPSLKDHIMITPDKGCVGSARDFLIDDFPEWANASNFPGTLLKFGGEDYPGWYHIVKKLRTLKKPVAATQADYISAPEPEPIGVEPPVSKINQFISTVTGGDIRLQSRFYRVVAEQLGLDELQVTDEKRLVSDLGADSLDLVELTMAIEDEFGLEIDDPTAERYVDSTIAEIFSALLPVIPIRYR